MFTRFYDELIALGLKSYVGTRNDYNIPQLSAGVVQPAIVEDEEDVVEREDLPLVPVGTICSLHLGRPVEEILETSDVFVGGGLFDALATRLTHGPPYVVLFSCRSTRFANSTVGLSPLKNRGALWTSCNLRKNGKFLRSIGVLSLWTNAQWSAVIYNEGELVMEFIERNWFISNADRNRLMHALNGNPTLDQRFSRMRGQGRSRRKRSGPPPPPQPAQRARAPTPEPLPSGLNSGFKDYVWHSGICVHCGRKFEILESERAARSIDFDDKPSVCFYCPQPAASIHRQSAALGEAAQWHCKRCREAFVVIGIGAASVEPDLCTICARDDFSRFQRTRVNDDVLGMGLDPASHSASTASKYEGLRAMFAEWRRHVSSAAADPPPPPPPPPAAPSHRTTFTRFQGSLPGTIPSSIGSDDRSGVTADASGAGGPLDPPLEILAKYIGRCGEVCGIWRSKIDWVSSSFLGFVNDPSLPRMHFGGLGMHSDQPRVGDYVVTCQFEEISDDLLQFGVGWGYNRIGYQYQHVEGCNVDGDRACHAGDWLHTKSRVFEPCDMRAILLCKTGHVPPLYVFRIGVTMGGRCDTPSRFEEFRHKSILYSRFKGRQSSCISIDGRSIHVSSQTLGEVLRYFANADKTSVCASHIMGHLKNSDTDALEIDYIMRFAAAWHDNRLIPYARAVSGDAWIHEEARLYMNGATLTISELFMALTGHGWTGWLTRNGCFSIALVFKVVLLFLFGFGLLNLIFPTSVFYGQVDFVTHSFGESCTRSYAHINGTYLGFRAADIFSMPNRSNDSVAVESAAKHGWDIADMYYLGESCGNASAQGISWWMGEHEAEASRDCLGVVAGGLATFFTNVVLHCIMAPLSEESFKYYFGRLLPGFGWLGCTLVIMFEFAKHYLLSGPIVALQYLPSSLLHYVYYYCGFRVGVVLHAAWNLYALGVVHVCMQVVFYLRIALSTHGHRSELCMLSDIVAMAFRDNNWPIASFAPPPVEQVFTGHQVLNAWNWGGWVAWIWSELRPSAPPHSMGGIGLLFMHMVVEFFAGRRSFFKYVEPMGRFSRYVEYYKRGGVAIKNLARVRIDGHRKARGKNRLIRLMPEFAPCASFAPNQANALHSCVGRVLKPTPYCNADTLPLANVLSQITRKMNRGRIVPKPREWADSFPGGKRVRYHAALDRLDVFGWAWFGKVFGVHTGWNKRSCFIKHEANLAALDQRTEVGFISPSDPRTIQASTDEVQAALGPWFVELGKRASDVFDGGPDSAVHGWRVLVGFGRTKQQIAAYCIEMAQCRESAIIDCGDDALVVHRGVIYALDAKRWDAHVTEELLLLKSPHLRGMGLPAEAVRLLELLIERRGSYKRLGVWFTLDGDVASGDADTLYWNTILGVVLLISCFESSRPFEEQAVEWGIEYEVAATAHSTSFDSRLDFCSCIFVPTRDGMTLAPKLGRSLMKLGVTATAGNPLTLLSAKVRGAMCDLSAYGRVCRSLARLSSFLPTVDSVSESYFPVGKVDPAADDDMEAVFQGRYGVSYADVCVEVDELVTRTICFEREAGDLVNLRRVVEVDYGKPVLPAPCSARPARGPSLLNWVLFVVLCLVVGGAVFTVFAGSLTTTTTTPQIHSILSFSTMARNNNNKKGAKRQNRPMSNGKAKMPMKGNGAYSVPTALAKALKMAVVQGVKSSIPKGTFERKGAQYGRGLSNIVGFGDYVVNDIVHANNVKNRRSGNEIQTVSNCEYVGDILSNGSSAFANSSRQLSATDSPTFPWLSQIAKLYTKYRFRQLLFEFRSMSSEYSSQIGLGTVVMAPIYNIDQPDFSNKQQMEAAAHAVSFKPSNSAFCGIECARKDNNFSWYNVRLGTMERTPLTDFARLNVAIAGIPTSVASGTVMGELWVHYTCDLLEPIISGFNQSIPTGLYGNIRSIDTAAGLWLDSAFSIAKSAAGNRVTGNPGGTNGRTITMTTGQPTSLTYFVAFDDTVYSSFQDRVWFSSPGVYILNWRVDWATAPTTLPSDTSYYWVATTAVGSSDTLGYYGNTSSSADRTTSAGQILLRINTANTGVGFRPNASFAGLAAAAMSSGGMSLDITMIPA